MNDFRRLGVVRSPVVHEQNQTKKWYTLITSIVPRIRLTDNPVVPHRQNEHRRYDSGAQRSLPHSITDSYREDNTAREPNRPQ